jgi:hypothetical protein
MLEVVTHRNRRMFLRSVKDSRLLRYPDGRPQTFTPNSIEDYTLWRWAESEAVKKAEALLYGCLYQPELLIEAIPADGEPIRLWLPFSGEHLVLPRGPGGRPVGSDNLEEPGRDLWRGYTQSLLARWQKASTPVLPKLLNKPDSARTP